MSYRHTDYFDHVISGACLRHDMFGRVRVMNDNPGKTHALCERLDDGPDKGKQGLLQKGKLQPCPNDH